MKMLRTTTVLAIGILASIAMATTSKPDSLIPATGTAYKPSDLYPTVRIKPTYSEEAEEKTQQACVTLVFSVDVDGKPQNIKIWSQYPPGSGEFTSAVKSTMPKWRFHVPVVDGKPVAADHVLQEFVFVMQVGGRRGVSRHAPTGTHLMMGNTKDTETVAHDTLAWLCMQPPMHGVSIVARSGGGAASPETLQGASGNGETGAPESVALSATSLPLGGGSGYVHFRFCVDDKGRLADTVIEKSSPRGAYNKAARAALERVAFSARRINGTAVTTCGLSLPVIFSGDDLGAVGRIGEIKFDKLSGTAPVPKLKSEKPVQLSLNIPAGTPLPKVAKVEVRMCIEKNGAVSGASVVQADPPQYFDQAALETVAGWRFASPLRRMCDVYQWVQFPLGGS